MEGQYTPNGQIQISYLGNNGQKTAAYTPSASNRYLTFNPEGYQHKVDKLQPLTEYLRLILILTRAWVLTFLP